MGLNPLDKVSSQIDITRSQEILDRAKDLIPGVSQLISRRPRRWALGVSPVYYERAEGCRVWDVDGNEYIDWMSAVGPIILGYTDPVVDEAVKVQISKGSISTLIHESAVDLAEELCEIIPSAEMVRYAKGGGGGLVPLRCVLRGELLARTRCCFVVITDGMTGI